MFNPQLPVRFAKDVTPSEVLRWFQLNPAEEADAELQNVARIKCPMNQVKECTVK